MALQMVSTSRSERRRLKRPWVRISLHRPHLERRGWGEMGLGGVMGEPRNTEDPAGGRGEERGHKWGHPPAESAHGWHPKGSKWSSTQISPRGWHQNGSKWSFPPKSTHGWHQNGSKWHQTQISTRGWQQKRSKMGFSPQICSWLAPKGLKMASNMSISSWLAPKWLKMVL